MKFTKEYPKTTAILLFAQSENAESISKPIAYQKKQSLLLWKNMNKRVLKTIQKTNLPYFISDENNQIGSTFGEKIAHAIQNTFNKGFEKVIVIGNDSIELKANHLLQANTKLQTNDVVLGADFNGGAYLIGVSKSSFDTDTFTAIPWQTRTVFKALQILFCQKKTVVLPSLNDCNSPFDLKKTLSKLSFSDNFRNLVYAILQSRLVINTAETTFVSFKFTTVHFNKGSPFSIQRTA